MSQPEENAVNVTLDRAYAEACQALGEALVTQRLLGAEVARLTAEVEALTAATPEPPPA